MSVRTAGPKDAPNLSLYPPISLSHVAFATVGVTNRSSRRDADSGEVALKLGTPLDPVAGAGAGSGRARTGAGAVTTTGEGADTVKGQTLLRQETTSVVPHRGAIDCPRFIIVPVQQPTQRRLGLIRGNQT